jgi:toxin ParE1/3/4
VKRFKFHAAARAEYEAAFTWYAERSHDAAAGWIERVTDGIASVCSAPEAWPTWTGRPGVRVRVLKRYPYSLVYVIERGEIVIVAVAHHKRRPGYWVRRLRRRGAPASAVVAHPWTVAVPVVVLGVAVIAGLGAIGGGRQRAGARWSRVVGRSGAGAGGTAAR